MDNLIRTLKNFSPKQIVGLSVMVFALLAIPMGMSLNNKQIRLTNRAAESNADPLHPFVNAGYFNSTNQSNVRVTNTHTYGKFKNMTIEALVFLAEKDTARAYPILSKRFMGIDTYAYSLEITKEKKLKFIYTVWYQNHWAPTEIVSNATIAPNTWTHVAVVYNNVPGSMDNGKLYMYINEQRDIEIPQQGEIGGGSETKFGADILVGTDPSGYDYYNGALDEVRISNGPKYIGSQIGIFTPLKLDPDTLLLMHFDDQNQNPEASMFDTTTNQPKVLTTEGHNLTYSLNVYFRSIPSPTPSPFINTGRAVLLDGKSYIDIKDPAQNLKITNDLTIESWIKISPFTDGLTYILSRYSASYGGRRYALNVGVDKLTQKARVGFAFLSFPVMSEYIIPVDVWTHIAVVRKGSILSLFINGKKVNEQTGSPTNTDDDASSLTTIGAWRAINNTINFTGNYFNGAIDELRFTQKALDIEDNWNKGIYFQPLTEEKPGTTGLWKFENELQGNAAGEAFGPITPVGDIKFIDVMNTVLSPSPYLSPTLSLPISLKPTIVYFTPTPAIPTITPTQIPTVTPTVYNPTPTSVKLTTIPSQPTATPALNYSTIGIYRSSVSSFFLKHSLIGGNADNTVSFGIKGDIPIMGDWDGDGIKTPGIKRGQIFYLKNSNSNGPADMVFSYGLAGDIPVAGDWNNDGKDTIGVYRNNVFYLRNTNTPGNADIVISYGTRGDLPVIGDWNGDKFDTIGIYRPVEGRFYLRNSLSSGMADQIISYGYKTDLPVVGDWNGDNVDTIGVFRNGQFMLRNFNTSGKPDFTFQFGIKGDMPLAGKWIK